MIDWTLDEASASQLPQKILFVHSVLEGFAAIDEDNRDFIVKLAAEFGVRVNVYLLPRESAAA